MVSAVSYCEFIGKSVVQVDWLEWNNDGSRRSVWFVVDVRGMQSFFYWHRRFSFGLI